MAADESVHLENAAKLFNERLTESAKEHVSFAPDFVDGFTSVYIDTDMAAAGVSMQSGLYFADTRKDGSNVFSADLYGVELDGNDGVDTGLNYRLTPIVGSNGEPLFLTFLLAQHVVSEAVDSEETDLADAFLNQIRCGKVDFELPIEEGEDDEKPVPVTLAQYKTSKVLGNHDLALKALNGLVDIAYGAPYYEISPRRKSRSKESYRITGSQDACARFFAERGGNVEQIKAVLETVGMLMKDDRAAGFEANGRVWFTLNTIVEEMSRTTAGTLQGRKCKSGRELVDAALEAASSAQIKGISPDGSPTNIIYPAPAVRLKRVTYNGEVYNDVWGFDASAQTVNSYAEGLGHTYAYGLLKADKPLSIDDKAVDRYIRDVLNMVRSKLYTISKSGKATKKSRTSWVQELSWETIFTTIAPVRTLDSRQKKKCVETFEKILKLQAEMEKQGEARQGAPIYIKAYSVRDASRGRGKGAWSKLVIEGSTDLHEPDINLG